MGKLLLGLLKLLLQLVIFALTGHWPRIGGDAPGPEAKPPSPRPAIGRKPARSEQRRASRPEPAARRGFDQAPAWSFEREGSAYEPESPPVEGEATDAAGRPIFVRRKPPSVRTPTIGPGGVARRSFASAVRDPRTVRDAVVLGALFGARRGPRR